jgi:Flp pilus assembly protein TadG
MRKRLKSQSGNAMLEFALSWAVLSALFTGIFQYGYTMWTYNSLAISVANAAQAGGMMNYDTADTTALTTAIQNMVVYGDPAGGTRPILPRLTTSNVSVDTHSVGGSGVSLAVPSHITVKIVNFNVDSVFGTQTFNNKPRVTTLYVGKIICSTC